MDTREIDGEVFQLVPRDRVGAEEHVLVYKGADSYLRIGSDVEIKRHVTSHMAMSERGFPVAEILAQGKIGKEAYYIERSLGGQTFRVLFADDCAREGSITRPHFDSFIQIVQRFADAQARAQAQSDFKKFADGIHLDILRKELPEYSRAIEERFERALQALRQYPCVFTHGDFNPSNMYPSGIIDFEDTFHAPFGFDLISAIETIEWFPAQEGEGYEYVRSYSFTPEQREQYLEVCDAAALESGIPPISNVVDEFAFCRAVWLAARMQQWPKTQYYRYDKLIKKYLS